MNKSQIVIPARLMELLKPWDNWTVREKIGEGAYGKVYRIERRELNSTYQAALKWISFPSKESEVSDLQYSGMSPSAISNYYENMASDLQKEIGILRKLRVSNVVSYEDHRIVRQDNGICWDILIRMELLTDLNRHFEARGWDITAEDVRRLGIDIGSALVECHDNGIIHRDIKPGNIFVAYKDNGQSVYKLGDFGIARHIDKGDASMTRRGTFDYMAPEVYAGEKYDKTIDIYSLGLVMYRLLNNRIAPFCPTNPEAITQTDRENALGRRLGGREKLPRPTLCYDSGLWRVLQKACAFKREERYQSAQELVDDLVKLKLAPPPLPPRDEGTRRLDDPLPSFPPPPPPRSNKKPFKWIALGAAIVAVIVAGIFLYPRFAVSGSPRDLKLDEAGTTYLNVIWSGGVSPFELRCGPAGMDVSQQVKTVSQRSAGFEGLIPATSYRVSLRGQQGASVESVYATNEAPGWTDDAQIYAGYDINVIDGGFFAYDRMAHAGDSLSQIAESADLRQMEKRSFSFGKGDAYLQTTGYMRILDFMWNPTDADKSFTLNVVIRTHDNRVFSEEQEHLCPGSADFYTVCFDMTRLFQSLYSSYYGWTNREFTVETYIDGYLYGRANYSFNV